MPRVSVVIPTYNHARFLGAALQSVLAQTFADWEAIVINNFSTDDTETVVRAFGDSRIRLENFANHGIIAASRNRGIELARGELVAFLDSDDVWYPRKLEACLQRLARGYDAVCHGERWIGGGTDREVAYGPESRTRFGPLLFEGNCLSTSAVVVRRDWLQRVGGFDERTQFVTAEDYHLWLKLASAGARIGIVDELLGEFRIHADNQSGAVLGNMDAVMEVIDAMIVELGDGSLAGAWRARRRRAIVYYSGARGLQQASKNAEATPWFVRAITTYPLRPKFYLAFLLNLLGLRFR